MRFRPILPLLVIAIALALFEMPTSHAVAPYTLSVSPNVPVSLSSTVTITLSISGGIRNQAYTVSFDVVKPNGNGSALAYRIIATDNRGSGSVSLPYPDRSFTAVNGTVATDVGGVYNVIVNQTSPTNIGMVATAQFTVSSQLTVVMSQPVPGTSAQRGATTIISVTVSSLNGPDAGATVSTNTPSNGIVFLTQVSTGIYSANYQVSPSDPLGSWTIIVQARDSQGNSGSSGPVTITIVKTDLIVDSLVTYNSKGVPATEFSPGDALYAFFRIRYSTGGYLTNGQYRLQLRNPTGLVVANLTAAYDTSRFGFYTATGYPVSSVDPSGTWSVVIGANSLNDGFGNTGPGIATSVPLQVLTSPLGYWPFIISGLIAVLAGLVGVKRLDTSLQGFDHLEQMMGGAIPRSSSLLILGDPGSGKSILADQILHEELESGRLCALLSYDAFPEDVQARMGEFGWDIISHLRKGRLKIVDCYSGLAGQGEGAIKDPSDLTELNIRVTAFIAKAKNGPVTLILDSLTPIFNGVEEKQAFNFLQTLSAKVKKTGGLFILTASKGAISNESAAKIKSMVDGVIEMSIIRSGRKGRRLLSVLKMERRKISPNAIPFEIDRSRGLVFRVSRFGLLRNRFSKFRIHLRRMQTATKGVRKPEASPGKGSILRER